MQMQMKHSRVATCPGQGVRCICSPAVVARPTSVSRTQRVSQRSVTTWTSTLAGSATVPAVAPAVLPGTPKTFPIPEDKLIELAKALFAADGGVANPSLLADDFRFEFPVVSLTKKAYVKAVSGFDLKLAIPDLQSSPYHWRVDPFEPNRVWFTVRGSGTHTGTLKFNGSVFPPSGKVYQAAPECQSFVFNEAGKCITYTGGYVMDRRVGNTQGLGALFGILAALGGPVLIPGSPTYISLTVANNVRVGLTGIFNTATFGLFKAKEDE